MKVKARFLGLGSILNLTPQKLKSQKSLWQTIPLATLKFHQKCMKSMKIPMSIFSTKLMKSNKISKPPWLMPAGRDNPRRKSQKMKKTFLMFLLRAKSKTNCQSSTNQNQIPNLRINQSQ